MTDNKVPNEAEILSLFDRKFYKETEEEISKYVIPESRNVTNKSFNQLYDILAEGKSTIERMSEILSKAIKNKGKFEVLRDQLKKLYELEFNNILATDKEVEEAKNQNIRLAKALEKSSKLKEISSKLENAETELLISENFLSRVRLKMDTLMKSHDTNSRQVTILENLVELKMFPNFNSKQEEKTTEQEQPQDKKPKMRVETEETKSVSNNDIEDDL